MLAVAGGLALYFLAFPEVYRQGEAAGVIVAVTATYGVVVLLEVSLVQYHTYLTPVRPEVGSGNISALFGPQVPPYHHVTDHCSIGPSVQLHPGAGPHRAAGQPRGGPAPGARQPATARPQRRLLAEYHTTCHGTQRRT